MANRPAGCCTRRQKAPFSAAGKSLRLPGPFLVSISQHLPSLREHSHRITQSFHQSMETEAVGVAVFADEGVEPPIAGKVIKNIFHQLRLEAAERELTLVMFFASEVRNRQH